MLDTNYQIETPENIDIDIRVAGPSARALAFLIDLAIRGSATLGIFYVFTLFQEVGMGIFSILAFLIEWFYPVVFEVMNRGRTPGKQTMGLQVLNDDGTPVTWSTSLLRNLLRFVDFLPAFYGVGLVTCCVSRQFKRLGDLAAGTVVVYSPPPARVAALSTLPPLPSPVPLSVDEQRAILSFAERANQLSESRQQELANHLAPMLASSDDDAVKTLQRIAVWLVGSR